MKKKVLSALVCAGLAGVLLAGCGSSSTDSSVASSTEDASSSKTYRIGICQLVQHEALDAATEGFQAALIDKLGKEHVEFDVQNASGDSATCSTITNQFVADGDDLILANATAALQAAASSTGDIPILGTSVTDYATALDISDWTGTVGSNISGTSDLPPLDQQADLIKELFPDATTVGILYCSAEPNSVYQADNMTTYLEELGYQVEIYTFADTNDVASVTQSACDGSDVLYIPTDNTAASCMETISNVATPANTPAIVGWEEGLNSTCAVATLAISYYDLGYQTGEMAYEILVNGADITTMAVETSPNVAKKYNADNCKTFGVSVSDEFEAYEVSEE
ncbi:ABC transporter substrate-binding protein [Eubacterium oxidoreducens]|uniref:Putative ABC transport system substrate-binding protein n=1 Tax=Eubacterium oxidoreducens TaxID=1732 RepID=A0A1G6AA60_EUBOX|nr:ABC transporter substrate-binding protein [Eubacterium oxidoreducens]SDB05335.1 putative ABC transport system substrate-binding protein [Eubacterium oxidoreducens]